MRRLATLLLPVLALSACYPGYRSGPDAYGYDRDASDRWYDARDVPLAARIEQTGIGLGIRLNRPAYVAVFEILPGQGVGLYYPAYQSENAYYPVGFSTLPVHGTRRFDSYFTGLPSAYRRGEPHFYFLVASRQPLRSIRRFQRSDGALRSVLGLTAYNTLNYRRVMDDLVQAVVPYQDDDDWTTDVLAIWPRNDGYYVDNGGYTRVYCRDGSAEILPIELARFGCTRGDRPVVIRNPRTTTPPPPQDSSTAVTRPGRHRPEPPATGDGGSATGTTHAVPQRRPGPEVIESPEPQVTGDGEARSPANREPGDVSRRERPRVGTPREPGETPRAEPRSEPRERPRPEPRTEPRSETPRPEPRSESPRSEPAPRPAPAPAPAPPPPPPAPRNDPAPSRPEPRPAPADPPSS